MVLPLLNSNLVAEIRARVIEELQPTVLLFLRKLTRIEVTDESAGRRLQVRREMRDSEVHLITEVHKHSTPGSLNSSEVRTEHWFVHLHALTGHMAGKVGAFRLRVDTGGPMKLMEVCCAGFFELITSCCLSGGR